MDVDHRGREGQHVRVDDDVTFSNITFVLKARDLSLGGLVSPINPPPVNGVSTYTASSSIMTLKYQDDLGDWIPDSGGGLTQVKISNNNGGNGNPTVYDTEMLQLNLILGTFRLRESPTKQSLGKHTIGPDPRGYRISSFFDVFLELSTDGGQTWIPADRSIRMAVGAPPAAPGSIFLSQDLNSIVLNWQNGFTLQSATHVTGPYLDVTVAGGGPVTAGPYSPPMTESQMFFRLRQ